MSNGIIKMKGGGGTTYSDVTTTTSNLPEYAEPYYRDLLARTGYETSQPYSKYGGSRIADFSPMEQEAMARYGQMGVSGTPDEMNSAMGTAYDLSQNSGVNGNISSSYNAGNTGGGSGGGSRNSGYGANQLGPEGFYGGNSRQMGYEAGTINDSDMINSYMSPYMQQVVDVEKREAMRDADVRHQQTGLDAAG